MGSEWFSLFLRIFVFYALFFVFFCSFFFVFLLLFSSSPKGQGQTTAKFTAKMGNFTPTPSAPTPCKTSRLCKTQKSLHGRHVWETLSEGCNRNRTWWNSHLVPLDALNLRTGGYNPFQKIHVSVKFVSAILGPETAAPAGSEKSSCS